MKKSILVLALPCLMALTLVTGKVFAGDEEEIRDLSEDPPTIGNNFYCKPSEGTCYEWHVENVKIKTFKGWAFILTSPFL